MNTEYWTRNRKNEEIINYEFWIMNEEYGDRKLQAGRMSEWMEGWNIGKWLMKYEQIINVELWMDEKKGERREDGGLEMWNIVWIKMNMMNIKLLIRIISGHIKKEIFIISWANKKII